jgi:hypothetical protein
MAWETFRGRMRKSTREPYVTFSRNGVLNLNSAFIRKYVGDSRFVLLMYDKDRNLVGMKFIKQSDHDAYAVRVMDNDSHGQISGRAFMKEYDIYPEKTVRIEGKLDEHNKIVVMDVSEIKGEKKKEKSGHK